MKKKNRFMVLSPKGVIENIIIADKDFKMKGKRLEPFVDGAQVGGKFKDGKIKSPPAPPAPEEKPDVQTLVVDRLNDLEKKFALYLDEQDKLIERARKAIKRGNKDKALEILAKMDRPAKKGEGDGR